MFDAGQFQGFVSNQRQNTTRSSHNQLGLFSLQSFLVLFDRCTTIEYSSLHIGEIFRETSVFVFDLESQLARMTQHNDSWVILDFYLLQSSENKDGGLSHTLDKLIGRKGYQTLLDIKRPYQGSLGEYTLVALLNQY